MNRWATLTRAIESHGPCALISVRSVKGSTPRDTDAWMIVTSNGFHGSIGGGTLEWQAIAKAQGYSVRANKSEVVLRRQGWNEGRRVRLDSVPLLIAPGDTITIQEAFF